MSNLRDHHRKEFTDIEWAEQQITGEPNCRIGDIIQFKVGGFGVIDDVNISNSGWPPSYSTSRIEGKNFHARGISSWHYEGDFTVIHPSPVHYFEAKA